MPWRYDDWQLGQQTITVVEPEQKAEPKLYLPDGTALAPQKRIGFKP